MEVNAHSLFSKWFSESGKLVNKLFDTIKVGLLCGAGFTIAAKLNRVCCVSCNPLTRNHTSVVARSLFN